MTALARSLRRHTTSGNWIPEIDGLRFIAIMAVLLFHMQGELGHHGYHPVQPRYADIADVISTGNRGVQLFFVLSGYILARPFASYHLLGKQRPSLRKYFQRRLTRLEPPYILNLLVCAVCFVFLQHVPWHIVWRHLAASIAYLHFLVFGASYTTLNSVAWSLEIEVQFYLLAPLLTMIFAIRQQFLRRAVLILSMLASAAAQRIFGFGILTLAGHLQYFLAGLLLVELALHEMQHWPHDRRWDLVSLAGWPFIFKPVEFYQAYWFPFLIVLLYVAALRGWLVYRFLRLQWVALFGGMCYTIYLWHPLVLSFVQGFLDRAARLLPTDYALYFLLQAVIKLAAVALVSTTLFVLIERPCMDPEWPHKLARYARKFFVSSSRPAGAISLEES